jgi:protein SCO1/2
MRWYRLRNLLLVLASAASLALVAQVIHELYVAPKPVVIDIGGPFELTDQDGARVTDETYAGRYMLIFFGYTYCPDVCPTKLAAITFALDAFEQEAPARAAKVMPLFVSVDPERDTSKVLREYRAHFHPRLVALTGTEAELRAVAKAYKVYFAKAYPDEASRLSGEYLMDHSAYVFLMGPDGRYVTHFASATTPDTMAARLSELVE